MKHEYKKKVMWTGMWLALFWLVKSFFHEFVYMQAAGDATQQLNGTGFDQAMAVKIANGFYSNIFYGTFAFIVFIIWIGPILNKIFNKQEKQQW